MWFLFICVDTQLQIYRCCIALIHQPTIYFVLSPPYLTLPFSYFCFGSLVSQTFRFLCISKQCDHINSCVYIWVYIFMYVLISLCVYALVYISDTYIRIFVLYQLRMCALWNQGLGLVRVSDGQWFHSICVA